MRKSICKITKNYYFFDFFFAAAFFTGAFLPETTEATSITNGSSAFLLAAVCFAGSVSSLNKELF
jgi:hypothetical protein